MAVFNIVMKRKNGAGFDTLYPRTIATQVVTDTSNRFVSDADITAWNGKIDSTEVGSASGVCPLGADSKIPVSYLPAEAKEVQIVADITARDAISNPYSGLEVLVLDATADATVDSGWAKYIYDGASYVKIGEEESLDAVVASVDWASITGKPTSTPAQIDGAVSDSHTHSNSATLNAITEAFTTALKTSYDGAVTNSHTHGNSATLDLIEEALTTALKTSYDNAVTNSHTHSNSGILDGIEESFTTALKTIYDGYNTLYVQAGEPGTAIDGDMWYEIV